MCFFIVTSNSEFPNYSVDNIPQTIGYHLDEITSKNKFQWFTDSQMKNNVDKLQPFCFSDEQITQWAFTCSKLTIETLEQGVKYVQS